MYVTPIRVGFVACTRAVQHWLQERRRHVVREAKVMQQAVAHYQQQKQQDEHTGSSTITTWPAPPPLLAWTFSGADLWAAGEESQVRAVFLGPVLSAAPARQEPNGIVHCDVCFSCTLCVV
jgi:hypothetical protein